MGYQDLKPFLKPEVLRLTIIGIPTLKSSAMALQKAGSL
jgi:hypothetical protein